MRAGANVGIGTDHTLFAKATGTVQFQKKGAEQRRTFVSVVRRVRLRADARVRIDKPRPPPGFLSASRREIIHEIRRRSTIAECRPATAVAAASASGARNSCRSAAPTAATAATAAASTCARTDGINTLADFRIERTFTRARTASRVAAATAPAAAARTSMSRAGRHACTRYRNRRAARRPRARRRQRCWSRRAARAAGAIQRFKSAPIARRASRPGPARREAHARLELKVIADVGLLGLPNAGKSTLIRAVSAATPEGGRLSVHDAAPESGRGRVGDAPQLRDGRHSRADRGRGRRRGPRHPVPQAPAAHARAAAPGGHRAAGSGRRSGRDARAIVGELEEVQRGAGREAALAGAQQARPAARQTKRSKRCKDIVRRLRWKGPVYGFRGWRARARRRCAATS